jgi:hypothetical protein
VPANARRAVDEGESLAAVRERPVLAGGIRVAPNPLTSRSRVVFALERPASVAIEAFDAAGRRVGTVAAGMLPAGHHALAIGALDPGRAGVYLLRLAAGDQIATRRFVRLP